MSNDNNIFVLSSGDADSILAAKIIALKHGATHLSSNRSSFQYINDGALLFIVRPFTGVGRLLELARRFNVVIYDLDIADEYKDIELLKSKGCDCRYCPSKLTISEFVWRTEHPEAAGDPRIVRYTKDYMRWELKHEESIPLHYAMELVNPKFGDKANHIYDDVLHDRDGTIDKLVANGSQVAKYVDAVNRNLCKEIAFDAKFSDITALCANAPGASSLFFTAKLDVDHYDVAMAFGLIPSNNKIRHTLYAIDPEVDVSTIARAHGGGGHKGAAGFTDSKLPFTRYNSTDVNEFNYEGVIANDLITSPVIEYIQSKVHGFQSRAFYGEYHGKQAVFYNSPYLTPTDFFSNIKTGGVEVGVQFCMNAQGLYRVATVTLTDESLPEVFGKVYAHHSIDIVPELVGAKFNQQNIYNDIFWHTT